MIKTQSHQLFEETLSLYGREYSLAVFTMPDSNKTNYYRCILDKIKIFDLCLTHDGSWIDMQNGSSELSKELGKAIEAKLLLRLSFY